MPARRPGSRPGGPRRPPARRPHPDPARQVAYDALRAVEQRDAYANLVLPSLLRERQLAPRDAAFATELTYGTLRFLGTYDAILEVAVDRPLSDVDAPVLGILRLGAHQLLRMRVPAHAAVSATVELARAVIGEGRSRFVNAVLRRIAARSLDSWLSQLAPPFESDPVGHFAAVHAHPRWIVSAFRDALGGSLDETAAALAADNDPAQVTLVARPGRSTVGELLAAGADPGQWSPFAATLPSGNPAALPAIREGRAGIQDEGSQLVALALSAAPLGGGPDQLWLDLCAGPGGKAALLAAVGRGRGARLLAAELQPHRARLVAQAVGDTAWTVVADGRLPAWPRQTFDRILLDAPCTGLGALRRRPEARWRRQPTDLPGLGSLQRALLRSALASVRPGGVVAYVTCSPHLAETRVVVSDVMKDSGGAVEQLDARPFLPDVPALGNGPDVQLWPHRHGTDAMYLALLRPMSRG
jgi:16S rRNA (cytosine967-C5)-methyltransferase